MSVGGSIFRAVAIRNSDLGVFELMWNPGATRNSSVTVVGLARWAVTSGTGAMVTEGALPDCAKAVAASSAREPMKADFCLGDLIVLQRQEATSTIANQRRLPIAYAEAQS